MCIMYVTGALELDLYPPPAGPWQQVNPQFWSRRNVLDWIDFHVEASKYDATLLNLDCCNMDGSVLCSLSRDAMMAAFGPQLGETLHQSLENLKHKQGEDHENTRCTHMFTHTRAHKHHTH